MKKTKVLGLEKPDLGDPASPEPFNRNSDELERILVTYEYLAAQKGNRTSDVLSTDSATGLDTWTSVITSKAGVELARRVDKESRTADGKMQWTTTVTLAGEAPVVVVDTETANGWTREVR